MVKRWKKVEIIGTQQNEQSGVFVDTEEVPGRSGAIFCPNSFARISANFRLLSKSWSKHCRHEHCTSIFIVFICVELFLDGFRTKLAAKCVCRPQEGQNATTAISSKNIFKTPDSLTLVHPPTSFASYFLASHIVANVIFNHFYH